MPSNLPSPWWEVTPCPSWCRSQHDTDDTVADRVHESDGVIVPVVVPLLPEGDQPAGTRTLEADLAVHAYRHTRGSSGWLYIGTSSVNRVVVALEYAEVLRSTIDRVLGAVDPLQ